MNTRRRAALTAATVAVAGAACTAADDVPDTGSTAGAPAVTAAADQPDPSAVLVGEQAVAACGEPASTADFDRDAGHGALPPARLPELGDPSTTTCTTAWEGTPTVVNIWATWCPPCREEMPELEAASQRLGAAVRFVGVDLGPDNPDDALALVDETGVTYQQLAVPDDAWPRELGSRGMPTTLLVAADGEVRWRHTGPITTDELLELVDEHLAVTP